MNDTTPDPESEDTTPDDALETAEQLRRPDDPPPVELPDDASHDPVELPDDDDGDDDADTDSGA